MAGYSSIQYVGFQLSNDKDHTEGSYAAISNYELYSQSGKPVSGGIYDLALGTTEHNFLCVTCSHGKKLCAGHRGNLNLNVAVIQPIAVAEIRKWLRTVCLRCGEIVTEREKFINGPIKKRLTEAASVNNTGKKCPRCDAIHPKIVKDEEDNFTFWVEPPTTEKRATKIIKANEKRGDKLYPDTLRAIFERVTDESVEMLGRTANTHPRNLIVKVINIPPNTIRPGIKNFGGSGSSNHDSTNMLQHIVRRNMSLPKVLPEAMGPLGPNGVVEIDLDKSVQNMQQLYYDYIMGSSSTNVTQGNNGRRGLVIGSRPVNSLMRNLPRKEGHIRKHLLGKRAFFISRSTISGNMSLKVDEVGVPVVFARTLQVKETVQEYNRDYLMTFFLNGRRQYPGCTHIIRRATGEIHDVAGLRDFHLDTGDVIFRDVIDGDIAYFNRAPSLERSAIGVHKVVVIKDPGAYTFQMNVLACEWYNADFDGDAMVLWVAREPSARAEAKILSSVSNWFISTKTGGPVNGQVQDSTIGSYELTRSDVVLDRYHAMGLFANTGTEPPNFTKDFYTGRDIISLLFEQTPISYRRPPTSYSEVYAPYIKYDPDEILTVMEKGKLLTGVLDKKSIGAKSNGGLFHLISREYGSQRALDLIFAMQQIVLQFLLWRGFTVSTADLLPSAEAIKKIQEIVAGVKLDSEVITDRLLRGEIVPPIDSTVHDFYEKMQSEALKVSEEVLRWILGTLHPRNNGFFKMISTGAKGSNPNLIHVSGVIGQTEINGVRIQEQFAFRRTLPYYPRFTTEPAAYGFVANSYMTGMTAPEFICRDMHGRFDLISKALATAGTGYFMRKGVMNNQSSIVDNLYHVSKDTKIVQLIYGENGLDPRELEYVEFRTVMLSDAKLNEFATGELPQSAGVLKAVQQMREDRDMFRTVYKRVEASNFKRNFTANILMPVNIRRIVDNFTQAENMNNLAARIEKVEELCNIIPYVFINEIQERKRSEIPLHKVMATTLMKMLIRTELNPRVLANITDDQLEFAIETIRHRYANSLIDYGSAVGVMAGHCISEPLTQYMLDSHHRSVSGGTKSGLGRIAEIYSAKGIADEQTSKMLLPLKSCSEATAQEIANNLEYIKFARFVDKYDIILEPYDKLIYPEYSGDKKFINEFEISHPLIKIPSDLTNWCGRFVLNKSAMVLKAVELELIIRRLRVKHPGIYLVHTSEAVPEIVIRVWIRSSMLKRGSDEDRIREIINTIINTSIRGIEGIIHAKADRVNYMEVEADGSLVKKEKYAVVTYGTNLYKAMLHAAIEKNEAISNSVEDTYNMFGIEAARAKIISETRAFMEDNTPYLSHLFLYADEMARLGKVTSLERGGLNAREPNNVLLRMAAGAPIQVVVDATLNNTKSKIYGIAAPQLLGSTPQIGSSYNSFVVNTRFVQENTKSVDSILDEL